MKVFHLPAVTVTLTDEQVKAIKEPVVAALCREHQRILKREAKKLGKALRLAEEYKVDYQRTRALALKAQAEIRELKK
jgi:hypothetical protein